MLLACEYSHQYTEKQPGIKETAARRKDNERGEHSRSNKRKSKDTTPVFLYIAAGRQLPAGTEYIIRKPEVYPDRVYAA